MGGGLSKKKQEDSNAPIDEKSELLNLVCDDKYLKLCNSNTKIFLGLTIFSAIQGTISFLSYEFSLPNLFIDDSTKRPSPRECAIFAKRDPNRKVVDILGITIFEKDEDCQEYVNKLIARLRLHIVHSLNQEIVTDPLDMFESPIDANNTFYNVFLTNGKIPLSLYQHSGKWDNIQSPGIFSQFAFSGSAQCKY